MSSLPLGFAALAIQAGIAETDSHFLFLQTGGSGTLDLFIGTATGNKPVFTLNQKVIWDGTGHPSGSPYFLTGSTYSGDYFINKTTWTLYHNTGISWNTGVSMIGSTGPQGSTGPTGSTGLQGTGIATAGYIRELLAKKSSSNYDTEWVNVYDILSYNSKDLTLNNYSQVFQGNLLDSNSLPITDLGSGVAFCPRRNSIFVIVDGATPNSAIYEYTLNGKFVRAISLIDFDDVEAISYGGRYSTEESDIFYIAEEGSSGSTSTLAAIKISNSTTSVTKLGSGYLNHVELTTVTKNSANEGVESIAYDPLNERLYFMLQRKVGAATDWYIHYLQEVSAGDFGDSAVYTLSDIYGIAMTEVRDMTYLKEENALLLVGYYTTLSNSVVSKISVSSGSTILDGQAVSTALNQAEGISISEDGNIIILTGEDSLNGADLVVLHKNTLSNPHLNNSQGLEYWGQNGINSVSSKQFEGIGSSVVTALNTSGAFVPSSYIGYKQFLSGFSDVGRSIEIFGNGVATITKDSGSECQLKLGFYNKLGSSDIGGIPPTYSTTLNEGISHWSYYSKIAFRSDTYTCFSSVEVTPITATGDFSKRNYISSGNIPGTGLFSIYLSTISGGSANYNGLLELYQLEINKD